MAALVFPLLLVLGALGGILVIIVRRLPDIREGLNDRSREEPAAQKEELSLSPRRLKIERPSGTISTQWRSQIAGRVRVVLRGAGMGIRIVAVELTRALKMFVRLFHRAPAAARIPQPGTRNGAPETTGGLVSPKLPIPTTTDVKRSSAFPLRLPEPFPEEKQEPSPPEEQRGGEPSLVTAPAAAEERAPADTPQNSVSPRETSAVIVETTREERTARRRRVVGRVRSRGDRQPPPPSPASHPPISDAGSSLPREEPGSVTSERSDDRPAGWVSTSQTIPALIEEGNFARAESLLIDVLSKDPRNTEAYRLLGTIYLKRQEYPQAKEVFEEALRRDPNHPGLHGLLGLACLSLGEYTKALLMYQRAHEEEGTNLDYLEKLLVISSRMDRRPLMKVAAQKILAIDPNHEQAKKVLARAVAR